MSSPIAHAGLMALIWPGVRRRLSVRTSAGRRGALFALVLFALLAPDADLAIGPLLGHSIAKYHNRITHSLTFAVLFAPLFGLVTSVVCGLRFRWSALLGLACCLSHLALDAFTLGRGIQLFWPFSEERVHGPPLFFGVRHSVDAPISTHVWTLACDGLFALALWAWSRVLYGRGRSTLTSAPVERGRR